MFRSRAVFAESPPKRALDGLLGLGLSLRHPVGGTIQAFSRAGEEIRIGSEEQGVAFLMAGNGLSLWLAEDHDLFVSVQPPGVLVAYFDGWTADEQSDLLSRLLRAGYAPRVEGEEDASY